MEDAQIVKLFSERKELALEETRLKYGEYCRVIAHNILGSEEDAEECINDALIRLWNIIPPHNPKSLKAMLGKITRNIALNRYDSSNAQKRGGGQTELVLNELTECFVSADNTFKIAEDLDVRSALNRFLSSLKPQIRIIFMQRYWYLCSVKETSKNLSVSESKVKMTLMRTRGRLKEFLKKEGIEI